MRFSTGYSDTCTTMPTDTLLSNRAKEVNSTTCAVADAAVICACVFNNASMCTYSALR
jgi:hypothetical protein